MGISIRAYARHRGLASDNAVRKAITAGRIVKEPDGTIDPVKADLAWARNTDPAQQRDQPVKPAPPAAGPAAGGGDDPPRPVSTATIKAAQDRLKAAGKEPGDGDGKFTIVEARLAETLQKMEQRQLRMDKDRGGLVDRAAALDIIFTAARKERDALTLWPARVAALMASELKVDPHVMETELDKHVRILLGELGEFGINIA